MFHYYFHTYEIELGFQTQSLHDKNIQGGPQSIADAMKEEIERMRRDMNYSSDSGDDTDDDDDDWVNDDSD